LYVTVRIHYNGWMRGWFGEQPYEKSMNFKKTSALLLIAFFSVVLMACHLPWRKNAMIIKNEPLPAILKKYHLAIETYEKGAYDEACIQFEAVRMSTTDKVMARKALFGLACARLMAAQTPDAYKNALELWETWVAGAPRVWDRENPLLLAPLIKEKLLVSNIPLTGDLATKEEKSNFVPRWLLVTTHQELSKYKERLAEEARNAQQSQKKIVSLEKEIKLLKAQIKALETIDQKIQKKKNAIPSAD
jgi:hypothetical protein